MPESENVVLEIDGITLDFAVEYKIYPGEQDLKAVGGGRKQPLLVVPCLNDRLLQRCKDLKISVIDLNGQAWVRSKAVLIDRGPIEGRNYRYDLEPRNIFVGKSERIVRSLLTDRDREWTQAELCGLAEASSGLVSRVVTYLLKQGYVTKTGTRTFRLHESLNLLDDWARADQIDKRTRLKRYAGLSFDTYDCEMKIEEWAQKGSVDYAFTQWSAAWQRHPYTEPQICSAYVSRFPNQRELESLGFREVPEAGIIWLYVPEENNVFFEKHDPLGRFIVSDAQIYLDLQHTGLRGPDAGKALRDWEGFCRHET
ncbi:MAG: hypothetical protein LAT83_18020 [Kiritimatiellae bacterium]|nr:hypothetical protein [Kiritimatiellia bacterium]